MKRGTRIALAGTAAALTAPIWIPLAFAGYVGWKMTRFAFRHATPVAIGICAIGAIAYAGCRYEPELRAAARGAIERRNETSAADLERRIAAPPPAAPAQNTGSSEVRMIDEPGYAYLYVRPGDTLSGIARRATSDPEQYRAIARENRIPDPDDVPVGTLLRIPDGMLARGANGMYDRVPALNSLTLPAGVTITQMFGPKAQQVIELNRALGLPYADAFPHERGERVVWFP